MEIISDNIKIATINEFGAGEVIRLLWESMPHDEFLRFALQTDPDIGQAAINIVGILSDIYKDIVHPITQQRCLALFKEIIVAGHLECTYVKMLMGSMYHELHPGALVDEIEAEIRKHLLTHEINESLLEKLDIAYEDIEIPTTVLM